MTASTSLAADVRKAMKGAPTPALDFLKNFKGVHDGAETASVGALSTKMFMDTRTLAGNANETLDLSGVLLDPAGNVLNFTSVKAIYVRANAANATNVVVGGAAANGWVGPFADISDKVKVSGGRHFEVTSAAGWAVVNATGDQLLVTNDGATPVTYDIVVIGA